MSCNSDVNELATFAQRGDKDARNALWCRVKSWACFVARRYRLAAELNGSVTVEDLEQCAALGVLDAMRLYNGERGAFMNWCEYYIRRECRKILGLYGRQRKEHYFAARLDEPLPGAEDLTLMDCIEDETSTAAMEAVEDRACNDVTRKDLERAMNKIDPQAAHIIRRRDLDGTTLEKAASEANITPQRAAQQRTNGINALRRDPHLRSLYAPNYYRKKGVRAFNTTFSSVVEDEVIKRIDSERRIYNEL